MAVNIKNCIAALSGVYYTFTIEPDWRFLDWMRVDLPREEPKLEDNKAILNDLQEETAD